MEDDDRSKLHAAATAAALLLATFCALALTTGVTQQHFEWASPPAAYAAALVRDGRWLRVEIVLDDVFVATYVTVAVLFASRLAGGRLGPLHVLMIAASVAGGVLDLEENHHILAMLRLAERGVALPLSEILHRTDLSQLKWMLAHVAFFLAGVAVRGRDRVTRVFRASLLAWQLPVGAATWAVSDPGWSGVLLWLRYASLLVGFATIAWLSRRARRRDVVGAVGSGAPA